MHEQVNDRIVLPEGNGDRYRIRIIQAGAGSSGLYPIDMLERDVPAAFPKGTRMRANHDGLCEDGGDIRRVIAKTVTAPWREGDAMYTDIRVAEGWSAYFREFADVIGVSISAAGEYQMTQESEDDDPEIVRDEATGLPIIAKLYSAEDSPYNAIDFVEAPGAGGRIVMALEGAKKQMLELNIREHASFASPRLDEKESEAVPPRSNEKGNSMDENERKVLVADITEAVSAKVIEAITPSEPTKDEAPDLSAVAESVIEAGLSKAGREAVYERIARGETAEAAIAKEKAREDEIKATLESKSEARESAPAFGYTVGQDELGGKVSEADLDAEFEKRRED